MLFNSHLHYLFDFDGKILLFSCYLTIIRWRHAVSFAKDSEERTTREAGEHGNQCNRVFRGGQQVGSIPQTVLIEEAVYTFAIGASTDGIGHVVLVGTEKLRQTTAVKVGIGVDVV